MIKKLFLVFILAVVLITAGIFYFLKDDEEQEFADFDKELSPLACDLNIQKCEVLFDGKNLIFELLPYPIYSMKPIFFNIYGLENFNIKEPNLEFYGLNMDMGTVRAKIKKDDKKHSAKIVLSACVIDVMRYRFEIKDGKKSTGIFIDFDLKI